ncbi:MAG: hypothetical protein M1837_005779 [Sclerophora amabilis]|nr:MAG: hypothetical protein M1837_005779 [Sclerophora amabilis]
MSYADAAAKGPKQTAEELRLSLFAAIWQKSHFPYYSRAPAQVSVQHSEESTGSLIDVDSEHVNTVPSDYQSQSVKTSTQAERLEHEAEDEERAEQAAYKKQQQQQHQHDRRQQQQQKGKKSSARAKAENAARKIKANSDNPVFVSNALVVTGLSAALGFGAYKKYAAGELSWKVAGAWAGVVGLFAAGDYYVSS